MKFKIFTLALALSLPALANDDFDLTDLIPAKAGQSIPNADKVTVKGDVVVGTDDVAAVAVAYQALIEEEEDGIKMIKVGSGMGILSVGSASYQTFNNQNASLLSKRGAYNKALLIAKKQFVANMKGVTLACANVVSASMDVIDSGNESVANTADAQQEACVESVSGSLAGYVTFDVNDDIEEKLVRVSLISTPKTRAQIRHQAGAVAVTTAPNEIFKHIISDLKSGILPPVGAKVLTNPETNENYVMGFGSAIVRDNKNKSIARKLKTVAKRQSETRARAALLGTLKGEQVYWDGSFDEKQVDKNTQFDYDPETLDPSQVAVLDEEQSTFINQLKATDDYKTLIAGTLPPGVSTKSFVSTDGHWQYTVAIYAPSLEKTAREANKEMNSTNTSRIKTTHKIKANGGRNENGKNSQAASGQVSKSGDL
ncbi:hypothetical protein H4J38_03880 [Colwellia sp. BRX10-3]|uniref:hypothetical protein n=1 Tax=Colwellia sp. BRX10-3 TaxID=2759844 RepID=UPI0015F42EF8|nr:hypothetical protein [Colwellia sp. BRX10-3]MBA6389916.1 hypothetical protein [Colwellia sp. BRX10-3]